jgi:PAS domain S-box-containing protein
MNIDAESFLNAKILIVDDQPANVMLLEQLLANSGYTSVSSTMNPMDVSALHREHDFDLILLDLQMPTMDGFQVMESLKNNVADAYLPVIVLTAQPGYKLRALQMGAKDFISKPFDLLEVKTRIRNMLEVRLLYKRLNSYSKELEEAVRQRTAELRESEARFRSFTELASDWYWEQDQDGEFTKVSGPVFEMLGVRAEGQVDQAGTAIDSSWNIAERLELQQHIAAREPFLDFPFTRRKDDGSYHYYRVSGEPMFSETGRFIGYRGIGIETRPSISENE